VTKTQNIVMLVSTDLVHDNRVRREAETLAAAGHHVTVYSHIRPADVPRLGWEKRETLCAVPVADATWASAQGLRRAAGHTLDLFRWGGSGSLLAAAQAGHADVYHAHDLDTLPGAAWLARRDAARLVYDSHELFTEQLITGPDSGSQSLASRIKQTLARGNYARLERSLIGRADAVITVSASIAEELATRYGIPRPQLLLNCPRYRALSGPSDYLRRRLGLADGQRILLLQGAVLPGRGQLELVQSLMLLPPEYVLVFLGFNLGTYQDAVRSEIQRLGLENRTFMLDALPSEHLMEATASADVGMILLAGYNKNDRFAMPNKLFEYMMAGLPFLATDWPEISRVARATGAGQLLSALTSEAIAGGVRAVLADAPRYAAMRQAGLAAAADEYNWERQAQKLLAVYEGL
jgi:glycosyltransferase involved in cell wall biosynthesis